MSKSYYKDTYIPDINRTGKITGWIGVFLVFLPPLAVMLFWGITPEKKPLLVALTAQLSVNAVWWFIEPISFFPILGVPGTYISFLSGNISNLRIPCAAAALKTTGVEAGSEEASIISTISISASVFVNVILLCIAVLLGSSVLNVLPVAAKNSLGYLLPALFGGVFAQFAIDDKKLGTVSMVTAILTYILYNKGMFSWVPLDPFIAVIIIPIFGTIAYAKLTYKATEEGEFVENV